VVKEFLARNVSAQSTDDDVATTRSYSIGSSVGKA
jgi:hypothetical protein